MPTRCILERIVYFLTHVLDPCTRLALHFKSHESEFH